MIEQSTSLGNGTDGQLACFRQCFDRYKNDTDWFAAIVRTSPSSQCCHVHEMTREMRRGHRRCCVTSRGP